MEKMKEIYERVTKDEALQAKFASTMKDAGADIAEKLRSFAKEIGYDVTPDEIQAFFKDLAENQNGQLSDAELDMVAGGKSSMGVLAAAFSAITLGITCAIGSIVFETAVGQGECGKSFQ